MTHRDRSLSDNLTVTDGQKDRKEEKDTTEKTGQQRDDSDDTGRYTKN